MKKFSAKKLFFLLFLCFFNIVKVQANIPVTIADIKTLIFYPTQEVSASVVSLHNSVISSEIHGRVEALPFLVGDRVIEGEVIAKLDCKDHQYVHEQARNAREGTGAKIEVAQWQLLQFNKLAKEQHVSTERLKTLSSELMFLQSQQKIEDSKIKQAKNYLSKCSIKAPFNAIVTARPISLGEFASPGVPLLQLLSSDKLEVQAKLHPKEAESIVKAKSLHFKINDKIYPVRLRTIVQALDDKTHTQEVRLSFESSKPLPGTFGVLTWQDPKPHLPAEFISQRNNNLGIFINKDNKAHFLPIQHALEGQPIPLTDVITENIIIEGRHSLEDGIALLLTNKKG